MNTFGDRLRALREARSWSQERLGFELEVTKATISKWENNRSEPNLRQLAALRRIFGAQRISLDYLICDEVGIKNYATSARLIMEGGAPGYAPAPERVTESADETALLARFRDMSGRRKKALLELLEQES